MERIAIPTAKGMLSPHFGGSEYFTIIDVEKGKIIKENKLQVPVHTTGSFPNFLADNNVNTIIVGGVGGKAIEIFNARNIEVYMGASVKLPAELVIDLLSGKLVLRGNSCNHEGDGPESHGAGHHHH